ncbi:hypothetical protein SOVF_091460 [Spinacia oleracea]|nr:hypothetical protein SOVF_091460 [Spinacia oleracea]
MAQQLKKSLVLMAMAMLVMALAVSAARLLDEQLPTVPVDQDTEVASIHGNTMNGCLNVKAQGAKPCGNLTTPAVGSHPAVGTATPAASLPPPPPLSPSQTGY